MHTKITGKKNLFLGSSLVFIFGPNAQNGSNSEKKRGSLTGSGGGGGGGSLIT